MRPSLTIRPFLFTFAVILTLGAALAGCGEGQPDSPITPAPSGPTFLYFYTDG
jgi:hypothetical protein